MSEMTARGFVDHILAHPDDDSPRLVFADWLDERGESERAHFIRAQCRLATMSACDPDRFALEVDAEELLTRHKKKWLQPLPKIGASIDFARGFPHRFTLPLPKLLEHVEALFDAAPTLAEYHPLKYASGWETFVKGSVLGRLTVLDLGDFSITGGRAAALLSSPLIASLKSLSIGGAKLGQGGTDALARSRGLGGLRHLTLTGCPDAARILDRQADSPTFSDLVSLHLRFNGLGQGLGSAGVSALARWPAARQLEALTIEAAGGDGEAVAFAAGEWPSLRKLSLLLGRMTEAGITALAACPSLAGLRELDLAHQRGQSLAPLFASPYLVGLERLILRTQPAAGSLEALAASPMLANLRGLAVPGGGKASAAGMAAVLASPASAGLVELRFADTQAIAAVARSFAAATHLTRLRRLSLGYTWHDKARWVCDILRAPHVAGVVRLDFGTTTLGEEALQTLLASPNLANLRRLWLAHYTFHNHPTMRKPVEERFGPVVKIG